MICLVLSGQVFIWLRFRGLGLSVAEMLRQACMFVHCPVYIQMLKVFISGFHVPDVISSTKDGRPGLIVQHVNGSKWE